MSKRGSSFSRLLAGSAKPAESTFPVDENGFMRLVRINRPERKRKEETYKSTILETRLKDRKIPNIDEGIREKDTKTPPADVIEKWYRDCHVGKYVHMEVVTRDGYTYPTERVQFEFSRMMRGYDTNLDDRGVNPVIERLSFATVKKRSFINNISHPLRYINYFIEYFDDDDELMYCYYNLMFQIMNEDIQLGSEEFITNMNVFLTTDSMINKVYRMVEHNANENLVKKPAQTYDPSIQMTVDHMKAIMGISCFHKFIIPLVSHYYHMRSRILTREGISDKELYYRAFGSFVPAFDDIYDVRLDNKLYYTASTRITKTVNPEAKMWERRERLGVTPVSYTNDLMRDFVTDFSQKAIFKKSAIIFINVCMDMAVKNTLKQKDKYDFTEIKQEASDSVNETQSKWDRWQIEKSSHSQREQIRSRVAIKDAIIRLGKTVGIDFDRMKYIASNGKLYGNAQEEYEFYMNNIAKPLDDAQMNLVLQYCSSYMDNLNDPVAMEMPDIVKFIMIMKRDLMARNYVYLPFFLSGKIMPETKKKYNKRRVEKVIMGTPYYDTLIEELEFTEGLLNKDKFYSMMGTVMYCSLTVVDYLHDKMNGQIMHPSEVCAAVEIMRFYCSL